MLESDTVYLILALREGSIMVTKLSWSEVGFLHSFLIYHGLLASI